MPKFRNIFTFLQLAISNMQYKGNDEPPNEFGQNPVLGKNVFIHKKTICTLGCNHNYMNYGNFFLFIAFC